MRFFLAFAIVACVAGGAWLWQGADFYWPARGDPSLALHLTPPAPQLLGSGLLATAGLGIMAVLQGRRGGLTTRAWQIAYFVLAMLAVALIGAAMALGEVVPNPESAGHASGNR